MLLIILNPFLLLTSSLFSVTISIYLFDFFLEQQKKKFYRRTIRKL